MKVFTFDPTTGRRGRDALSVAARYSYASTSVEFAVENNQIEPIEFVKPNGFGGNTEVVVHIDAGITNNQGEDISYQHETEWRCFSGGEMQVGTDTYWDWVVIPPASAIITIDRYKSDEI